jgi:hypothetical protein
LADFIKPDKGLDLREVRSELLARALDQASADDHAQAVSSCLQLQATLDDGPGFLNRRLEKAAGVDNHNIGFLRHGTELEPRLGQKAQNMLGVYKILGAAEGDYAGSQE